MEKKNRLCLDTVAGVDNLMCCSGDEEDVRLPEFVVNDSAAAAADVGEAGDEDDDEDADDNYDAAIKFIVSNENMSLIAGTHNEESSYLLMQLAKEKGILKNNNRLWFGQLYGMSDHISFNLAEAGYNVAKYLPYGPVRDVMPYLIRRAEENTSVAGQTSRELNLLKTERKRRKV